MCQRQDGWVDQLPNPGLSHFFRSTKTQVWNLSDNLNKVLGVLGAEALYLASASLQGGSMGHNQDRVSQAFALRQDLSGYLEAPADVCVIGL